MPHKPLEQTSPNEQRVIPLAYNMRVAPQVIGISRSKIYQLAAKKKIKLAKVGGRTVLTHDEAVRIVREGYAD